MRVFVKALLILSGVIIVSFGVIVVRTWMHWKGYGQAERMQPAVWEVAAKIRELNASRQPLPASIDGMLSALSDEQRQKIRAFPLRWSPGADPVFAIKIDEHWGFTIAASGDPQWMRSPKKDFPK